jgi:hypothetical protein
MFTHGIFLILTERGHGIVANGLFHPRKPCPHIALAMLGAQCITCILQESQMA